MAKSKGGWQPLRRATGVRFTDNSVEPMSPDEEVYVNRLYQVHVHRLRGSGLVLSIKPRDGTARHDWREFLWIKDQLAGEDAEAVELYPAAARLVDTANQFWLYCLPAGQRFPFGFNYREVSELVVTPASTQRRWPREKAPADLVTNRTEMVARLGELATFYEPGDFERSPAVDGDTEVAP